MFYFFNQNNSGGFYIINDDVKHYVIIEAKSFDDAYDYLESALDSEADNWCECCGERWNSLEEFAEVAEVPSELYSKLYKDIFGRDTHVIIHFANGEREIYSIEEVHYASK